MKKISLVRDSETYAARANSIKSQLMLGKTDMDYLNFIQDDYADTIKDDDRKLRYFQRDRERDVAINALMLGTGIRVSELANANLKDRSKPWGRETKNESFPSVTWLFSGWIPIWKRAAPFY